MKRLDSVAILASAGSGKTFVLTSRFLALLLAGVDPERILAVTFTRAAAREILDRLLERLCEASENDGAAVDLEKKLRECDTVPVPSLTAGACRAALRRLVSAIDRLGVGTIDSFFARLAGAMEFDLDLPPGWTIAEEDEHERLRSRAVEEIVERLDSGEIVRLVRLLHRGMYSPRVFAAVLSAVEGSYSAFLEAPSSAWEQILPPAPPLSADALREAIVRLRAVALPTNRDGRTVNASWSKAHAGDLASAETSDWECVLKKGVGSAVASGKDSYQRVAIPDGARAAYSALVEHARAVLLERLRDQNLATRDALARFDAAYSAERRRRGACTFDDLPRALLRAAASGDLEHMYFALDGRLDHALIDEFQDTSLTQFRLLRPVLEEMVSDDSGARSVLCVGDAKQSLYQWRDAEPSLLGALREHWPVMQERPLDRSFRSAPEIIDAVNRVFEPMATNPALATEEGADAVLLWSARFRRHSTNIRTDGFVSLTVSPDPGEGSADRVHTEHAARHIADLAGRFPDESIGVLFPKRKRIPLMLARLRAMGVDAVVESGAGIADSAAVAAVLSLLMLADFPGNTAAAFHVATSPLGPVLGLAHPVAPEVADAVAATVRRELAEYGYGATIARWRGAVLPACDARDAERLARLVELGERYDGGATLRPFQFVAFAGAVALTDTPSAQVRLLTVHGSKGLQFARVVLPELEVDLKPRRPPAVVEERDGALGPITAVSRYASEVVRSQHPRLDAMHRARYARLIGENLSVLYVAMTRAQKRLDMIVRPREQKDAWPKTFAGLLHGALAQSEPRAPGATIWTHGTEEQGAGTGRRASPVSPGPAAPEERITPGAGTARHTRATPVTPSRLGAPRPATVAEALEPAPAAARERGVIIHSWLERVEWLDEPLTVERVRAICAMCGGPWDEGAAAVAADLADALRSGAVAELFRRAGAASRAPAHATLSVHTERDVIARVALTPDAPARLLFGRIDRLVLARNAGRVVAAEIVDYKTETTRIADEGVRAAYAVQLRAYRGAIAAQYRLDPGRVKCCVALVLQGRAVWID